MTDPPKISRRAVLKSGMAGLAVTLGGTRLGRARAASRHPLFETEFDSSERYADPDEVIDDFEDLDDWEVDGGSLDADTDVVYQGSQSACLTSTPDDGDIIEITREFDGLDLSEKDLSVAIRLGSPEVEQLVVTVEDEDGDSVTMNRRTITPTYGWFRIDLGVTSESGDPDLSEVEEIRMGFNRDSDAPLVAWFDELGTTERVDGGRVVLTFDDGGISQYTRGLPVVEDYGFPALTCVNPGRADDSDYLGEDEMREMRDAGWEIGSHTVDHERLTDLSDSEVRQQVADAKEWLLERGFERGASMFTYPWSSTSPRVRDIISDYHYLAFVDGSMPHGGRLTGPLTVGRVFGENLDRVDATLELAEKYDQTVVLAYHDIGKDTGWISEPDFRATMDDIERRGLEVIRPSSILTELMDPVVDGVKPLSIRDAIATDGEIDLSAAQRAVYLNKRDEYVPRTNGKRMDDDTLESLLREWEGR